MFKTNLSPLNPHKDKWNNVNYPPSTNDAQNMCNHHQSAYQYKGMYTGNNGVHYKQEMGAPSGNYNPPLSPLSPNISKNPMSPTAKIKMFSNTLTLNKKPFLNTNPLNQQNTQDVQNKQPKLFSKMGIKNLTLNLKESIDLKCDQVLQNTTLTNHYRKQTPQQPVKQTQYGKRTGIKIPVLNLQGQIDDLKCDEVLEIRKNDHDDSRRNLRTNNGNMYQNGGLTNNDLENNFTYTNMMNKNFVYHNNGEMVYQNNGEKINLFNGDKVNLFNGEKISSQQGPLTPGYDRKKINPLINMRKHTDRQNQPNNNSNPSSHTIAQQIQQQKPRSFTNIVSPHLTSKYPNQQNNQEQHEQSLQNQSHPSIDDFTSQKRFQEMKKLVQRTSYLLEAYKKEADQVKEKLNEVKDKNSFLEKQNMQLRKCLYEEGSNSNRNNTHNYPLTPGANRYQGIK